MDDCMNCHLMVFAGSVRLRFGDMYFCTYSDACGHLVLGISYPTDTTFISKNRL